MPSLYGSVVEQFERPLLRDRFISSIQVDEAYLSDIVSGMVPELLAAAHRRSDSSEQVHDLIAAIDEVGLAPRSVATGLPDRVDAVGSVAVDALFGNGRRRLSSSLARNAGVTPGVVVAAMPWLSVAVMTALARRRWAGGLDVAGIRLLLDGEIEHLRQVGLLPVAPPPPLPPAAARPVPVRFRPVGLGEHKALARFRSGIKAIAG